MTVKRFYIYFFKNQTLKEFFSLKHFYLIYFSVWWIYLAFTTRRHPCLCVILLSLQENISFFLLLLLHSILLLIEYPSNFYASPHSYLVPPRFIDLTPPQHHQNLQMKNIDPFWRKVYVTIYSGMFKSLFSFLFFFS